LLFILYSHYFIKYHSYVMRV